VKTELRALIQATAELHPDAGAAELALYVAQNTPAVDVRAFYRDLLENACRTVINKRRNDGRTPAPRQRRKPRTPSPSPKLEERRSWWRDMLASPMHVRGDQKALADCTIDDLRFCMKDRDAAIGRIEEQMSNLRHLIALMTKHGACTVKELPEQQPWKRVPA
jgi:hypothetical protein